MEKIMSRIAFALGALLFAAPLHAQEQQQVAPSAESAAQSEVAEQAKMVAGCEGEKFVFAWGAGAKPTRITLCSDKGASPTEVVTMLRSAVEKLQQMESIAEDRRTALVQQIEAKIVEIEAAEAAAEPDRAEL